MLLKDITRGILWESVSANDINDAIDNHRRVLINYDGDDKVNRGPRMIEVYAYGLTSGGNPVIRAWQQIGKSQSNRPTAWKYFRLDRITQWKPTNQTFSHPASFYYRGYGDFNPTDDKSMSVVYKIASFGDNNDNANAPSSGPKTKSDEHPQNSGVYKTDTELRMERLRQQMKDPLKLSDLKIQDSFKGVKDDAMTSGPKTKSDEHPTMNSDSTNNDDKTKALSHYYWQNRDKRGHFQKGYREYLDNDVEDDDNAIEDYLNTDHRNNDILKKIRDRFGDKPIRLQDLKDLMNGNS